MLMMRKSRSAKIALATLIVLAHGLAVAPVSQAATSYSGESLFQGLVQFRGPVAALVPEIAQLQELIPELVPTQALEAFRHEQDQIVLAIQSRWPGFLEDFKGEVESGDHLRVQIALHDAYGRVLRVLADDPDFKPYLDEIRDSTEAKSLIADTSAALGKELLLADVDRLLEEAKLEGGTVPIGFCAALNLVLIVNVAVYFNAAFAQNIWRYLAVRSTVAIQVENMSTTLLPGTLPESNSIAFQERMNSGRLVGERMIDNIVKALK
ncbi:MAG: hypothetical protein SF066_12345 [Thermoanaerobaculia bacterium]|nr:hypothetical protein [Thermoanaerobaculia bacterium]